MIFTLLLTFLLFDMDNSNNGELPDIDELWDYSKPAETEAAFRKLIPLAREMDDMAYYVMLHTQIARTQSLQHKFDNAHALLDYAHSNLTEDMTLPTVRHWLERGRTYNSEGQKEEAIECFVKAYEIAIGNNHEYYAVDAAHMLGIAETKDAQLEWNFIAIETAEQSEEERTRKWLGALYNNVAWSFHDMEHYHEALEYFEKGLEWRKEQNDASGIIVAKWAVGRTLRSLNRPEEAIKIHQELIKELKEKDLPPDGYVHEEMGENLFLLRKEKEAATHFGLAYEILSQDQYLQNNEPERLKRLKDMSKKR
ncbi:MAG: tetratricopeptide repeat protein [Chitinophagaceae bacterium]|nr:MAG: tetratricopeptide repeat protein [Chitinophagaceae bacterium]